MPGTLATLTCLPANLDERPSVTGPFAEPLSGWVALVDRIAAIVNLAALMKEGIPGSREEWIIAMGYEDEVWGPAYNPLGGDWHGSPWLLSHTVQEILDMGNVRPLFRWRGGNDYGIEIGGSGAPFITDAALSGSNATTCR